MTTIYYGKELYHFGTKGQKWGVRNYQNPDGSYTAKGEGRYNSDVNKSSLKSKIGSTAKKVAKTALIGAGAAGLAYFGGKAVVKGIKNSVKNGEPQKLAKMIAINKAKNSKLGRVADKIRKKSYTEHFIDEITSQLGTFGELYSKSDTPEKMAKAKAEVDGLIEAFRNIKLSR